MTAPSETVTFLFTDVERSTQLWERSPDAMRAALVRHDALAADLVSAHNGLLIKSRGEGDSLFTVFPAAPDAAHAACALQRAFAAENWPAEAALRVRMALHTGEADLRERDYYGVAVNRCARLRLLALGGQILVSSLTRSLVQDALPEGAALVELGLKKLRDLADPEFVYQLTHPSLPAPRSSRLQEETPAHTPTRFLPSLSQYEADLAEVKAFLVNAHQSVRLSNRGTNFLQVLKEANRAGLEEAKKVMESERTAQAAPALTDYDEALTLALNAHPDRHATSRLDLLRALTQAGITLWEAKRIVDDFCRRLAPNVAGYDGGLLKSLAKRVRGPQARDD